VNVRPATAADLDALAALEADLFGADAWSGASVAAEVAAGRVLVADDEDIAGYVVTLAAGDVLDLLRIAVSPDRRRHGLARALLAAASTGRRMLLEVSERNEGAIAFYATEGFTEIARRDRYYRDGSAAVVMERLPQ
jgi:[ribosomal protein S18]-alanine N-acetyltransferase